MGRNLTGYLTLAVKFGGKIGGKVLSPLLKGGKSLKFILGGASFTAYSYLLSVEFALLLMGSIAFHEMGHLLAMKYCDMETKGMYFIPMLGAAAVPEEDFDSHKDEAFIAAAGPVFGLALAVVTAGMYLVWSLPIIAAAAAWMAMVNLFNLLPVKPLDGGRILSAISFSVGDKVGFYILTTTAFLAAAIGWFAGLSILYVVIPIGLLEVIADYSQDGAQPLTIPFLGWTIGKHRLNPSKPLMEQTDKLQRDGTRTLKMKDKDEWPEYEHLDTLKGNDKLHISEIVQNEETSFVGDEDNNTAVSLGLGGSSMVASIPESSFWEIVDSDSLANTKGEMSRRNLAITGATYIALTGLLVGVMYSMQHVPGAEAALNALA